IIRRPPRSTPLYSSAASDVYKRQLFSWVVLGCWKGFGYCFLTDWHYDVLRKLGKTGMPNSYIAFLIKTFSGWMPDENLVEILTLALTLVALSCTIWVNFIPSRSTSK